MKACLILLLAVVFVAFASGEKRLLDEVEPIQILIRKLEQALRSSTFTLNVCEATCHAIAGQYIDLCDAACRVVIQG